MGRDKCTGWNFHRIFIASADPAGGGALAALRIPGNPPSGRYKGSIWSFWRCGIFRAAGPGKRAGHPQTAIKHGANWGLCISIKTLCVCWENSTNITPGICEIHFMIQQGGMDKALKIHPKAAASGRNGKKIPSSWFQPLSPLACMFFHYTKRLVKRSQSACQLNPRKSRVFIFDGVKCTEG